MKRNVIFLFFVLLVVFVFVVVARSFSPIVQEEWEERRFEELYEAAEEHDEDLLHETMEEYEDLDESLNENPYYVTAFDFYFIDAETIELTVTYQDGGELKQITTRNFIVNDLMCYDEVLKIQGNDPLDISYISIKEGDLIELHVGWDLWSMSQKTFKMDLDYVYIQETLKEKKITPNNIEDNWENTIVFGAFDGFGGYYEDKLQNFDNVNIIIDDTQSPSVKFYKSIFALDESPEICEFIITSEQEANLIQ